MTGHQKKTMALVDYSSSEEEQGKEGSTTNDKSATTTKSINISLKRKHVDDLSDLPPLPSKFHDLYASTTRLSTRDDPALHHGRKRVTPHIEGNWPAHIYIEWHPSTIEYDALSALISSLKAKLQSSSETAVAVHSSLTSDLDVPLPLHVSLSRSLGFTAQKKDDFLASLEQAMKCSGIRPFELQFAALDWVSNFERSRWFLVLRLEKPTTDGLNMLLHVCNKVVQDYGQAPLYITRKVVENSIPSKLPTLPRRFVDKAARSSMTKIDWSCMEDVSNVFHVSIAWMLEAPSGELLDITNKLGQGRRTHLGGIRLKVDVIKLKAGNVVTNIPLLSGVTERSRASIF